MLHNMDAAAKSSSSSCSSNGKWYFNDYKVVKIFGTAMDRIAFQRKGKYVRGISITKDAFHKMEDVTIVPGEELSLGNNIYLKNRGKSIILVKYCQTSDNKCCEGGFFSFTQSEWMNFWMTMRPRIIAYWNE